MPVGFIQHETIHSIAGVRLASVAAGIRYQNRDDCVLIEVAEHSSVAAVFTKNAFRAAPVELAANNIAQACPRYLIINAGNANAGVGDAGMLSALQTTQAIAAHTHVEAQQVCPFSTGVIGERLDADKIIVKIPELVAKLDVDNWRQAASAIMTTDTQEKIYSKKIQLQGKSVCITGMAKGSGMIQPNMATMLSYIATDCGVQTDLLQKLLTQSVATSFNAITVDSDTSTNDACVLIATGESKIQLEHCDAEEYEQFLSALNEIMRLLAQSIVRDGEGASKFITVQVQGAQSLQQAKTIAFSVANSPLVKTACAASDANWGRIMAAAGKVDDDQLDLSAASLKINDVLILQDAQLVDSYTDAAGMTVMAHDDICITLDLHIGDCEHCVWTTDLTHEYIRINAEYRS